MNYFEILQTTNYWGTLKKAPGKPRPGYLNILTNQAQNKNISAVIGVRRSGKSTILKQLIHQLIIDNHVKPQNTLIVNLEDPRLLNLLTDNQIFNLLDTFKNRADLRSPLYLVLDEIQNIPNWETIIRTIHDQEPNLKLFITGSSAQLLGKELGTKLAGRYLKTEIFPLSFSEFKTFTNQSLSTYIQIGGFPDPILTTDTAIREQLLKDYYESILLRDITTRYNLRDEFKLRRLASQLFASISNPASSYRFSKDLEVSADTVLQYFQYIEDAYLGFFIPKYSHSVRKQSYNPKKFYSIDNGLQSAVSFRTSQDLGKLFENTVFLTLRRKHSQIFYWQENHEVDFIVKDKQTISHIINVSVSIKDESTYQREIESLTEAMHELKTPNSQLITLDEKPQVVETETGTIQIIPFTEFETS